MSRRTSSTRGSPEKANRAASEEAKNEAPAQKTRGNVEEDGRILEALWPIKHLSKISLTSLEKISEAHFFNNPPDAARALMSILHAGDKANAAAYDRRSYVGVYADTADTIETLVEALIYYLPGALSLPSSGPFIEHAESLADELRQLGEGYVKTSWTTKQPFPLRRISWDLADLWESATGTAATAWLDGATGAMGGGFFAFLADLAQALGHSAPSARAVANWLRERRRQDDMHYSDPTQGLK